MSTYATLCYVAIAAPVIVAGQAADHFGLEAVTAWFFGGLVLVVALAFLLLHRAGRRSAS